MRERTRLDNQVSAVRTLENNLNDNIGLIELGESEGDETVVREAEDSLLKLKDDARAAELDSMLSGEMDHMDAYLEVNSGAGGTESCDWSEMLLRMYTRWAEQRGFKVNILHLHAGEEAGIKSAVLEIRGENAFGWLRTENGVHRLVRISPFDSSGRRHTSFSSVAVSPVVDDTIEIDLNESDIRMDTYRAQGAGGQHVNTTDSAVRLTHVPTGVVAACQSERSQHKNRATALKMLKAKLYELERQKQEEEKAKVQGEKTGISWGNQIRSYVLQPYQMVKDHRTGVETSDTQGVLNGDLDAFMEASLAGVTSEDTDLDI